MFGFRRLFNCPMCGTRCTAKKIGDPNRWTLKHPTGTACRCPRDAFIAAFEMTVKPPMQFPTVEKIWDQLVKENGNPLDGMREDSN